MLLSVRQLSLPRSSLWHLAVSIHLCLLQGLVQRFVSRKVLWMSAVHAVAELDALMSLATAAVSSDGPMCRPVFHPASEQGGFMRAGQLRHPAGITGRDSTFVANDISLGGESPGFLLLTGPNMGGKSTLLRQVCLAAILAQVGGMAGLQ